MGNRSLHWIGSTAGNIDAFDFNVVSNWKHWTWLNGRWQYVNASYAPSNSDSVYFGLAYQGVTPTFICLSPCLFGGYSGGSSGGTNCWANGMDPSGTTFNTALSLVVIGDYRNNSGNYSTYPFPYFGTGITGDTLTWVTDNYIGVTLAGLTLPRTTSPINLKGSRIEVFGIGVAGSLTQFTTTKNFAVSSNGLTGTTASYFVNTTLLVNNKEKRSGDLVVNGGSYNKLTVAQHQIISATHNWSSQTTTIMGATIGTVYQTGSNNLYLDEACRIGNLRNESGWWNGPTYFFGKLDTTLVNNQLFVGLSGGTGGTAGTEDSTMTILPMASPTTAILGMETSQIAPYNTPLNISADMSPTLYFGSPEASISTAKQINVSSSGTNGYVHTNARWAVKFGGASSVTVVSANNSTISTSGNTIESTVDEIEMPLDKTITIKTLSLANNSILDMAYNSEYDGWKFGDITDGILSGGILFLDETCIIKGSKNMNLVNDNTIEGARWSNRFNRFAEIQLPAIIAVPL